MAAVTAALPSIAAAATGGWHSFGARWTPPSTLSFPSLKFRECPRLYLFPARNTAPRPPSARKRRKRGTRYVASDGRNADLEAEIFKFMQASPNPKMFPSLETLVAAGRADLAGALAKQSGWLVWGWDLEGKSGVSDDLGVASEHGTRTSKHGGSVDGGGPPERRVNSTYASSSNSDGDPSGDDLHADEQLLSENPLSLSHALASSSERESEVMDGPGKGMKVNGNRSWNRGTFGPGDTSAEIVSKKNERGGHASPEILADDTIYPNDILVYPEIQNLSMDAKETATLMNELQSYVKNDTQKLLRDRPQQLESNTYAKKLESNTSTAFQSSKSEPNILLHECQVNLREDVHSLSAVSESHENEIINAQDKLELILANLKALEGKMVLAIEKAEKMIEEERKIVNSSRPSLGLLRTVHIFWARAGLEVFLMGSFNGWSNPMRMIRSKSGVFTLYLKLYPGRYEIKFVVDRVWKLDPLRPIVQNSGFKNNLLIVE